MNYDAIDSRMDIEVISPALAHPPMLVDVLGRLGTYHQSARRVTVTCREPERDGSITYILQIEYLTGGKITVGALRRSINAETEYHS